MTEAGWAFSCCRSHQPPCAVETWRRQGTARTAQTSSANSNLPRRRAGPGRRLRVEVTRAETQLSGLAFGAAQETQKIFAESGLPLALQRALFWARLGFFSAFPLIPLRPHGARLPAGPSRPARVGGAAGGAAQRRKWRRRGRAAAVAEGKTSRSRRRGARACGGGRGWGRGAGAAAGGRALRPVLPRSQDGGAGAFTGRVSRPRRLTRRGHPGAGENAVPPRAAQAAVPRAGGCPGLTALALFPRNKDAPPPPPSLPPQ